MTVTSTAFQNNEKIPAKYTCSWDNVNPPLTFSEVSTEAKSLVLIMDDPDAPNGAFTHWVIYDMSPATLQILENNTPETGKQGINDFKSVGYGGPCPPSGTHRYFFKLYALRSMLNLPQGANRQTLEEAMKDQVIDSAELIGRYSR
jgi:Raf kinase inhibitor-like YbhB/YbcL family protein